MSEDLRRFDIVNGIVTAVYEFDNGIWELDDISDNEIYTLSDNDVIESETYATHIEVKTYSDLTGDGSYTRISEQYLQISDGQPVIDDSSSDSDTTIIIDGQVYELEDSVYDFDLTVDDSYQVGDDVYQVIDGLVYELEDDGYYSTSNVSYVDDNGDNHHVEDHYNSIEEIEEDSSDDQYVVIDGVRFEVESETEALSEDQSLIRLYQAVFDRTPDEGGYEFWSKGLDSFDDLHSVTGKFTDSDEFQSIYAGLDNEGFLAELYQNVLGREGDEGGFAWWLDNLNTGAVTTTLTVLYFSESDEFIENTSDDVDNYILTIGQHSITEDMLVL
tara:strand:+ start:6037 stop:7026 length:990 start_codon:yes stop_codon:yes gene_type:complete